MNFINGSNEIISRHQEFTFRRNVSAMAFKINMVLKATSEGKLHSFYEIPIFVL